MSLFAIGGANSAVPEIHRFAVDVQHWMTDPQFSDIFGLAQLTPGPNVIVVTLIGYHVAGLAGALVATLAMCGPTCLLAFYVGRTFDRFRGASWQVALAGGLVPVTLGLTAASAVVVARAADDSRVAVGNYRRHRAYHLLDSGEPALDICRGGAARLERAGLRRSTALLRAFRSFLI